MNTKYALVPWAESTQYLGEPWFNIEAIPHPDNGSYFIPFNRLGIVENPALDWSVEDARLQLLVACSDAAKNDSNISDSELFALLEEFFEEINEPVIELINSALQNKLLEIYGS